ncbi:50S ribosomal protein L4 [bacterium]|nr:50S ribosomal protein L4 [bacterium]
MNVPVYNRQGQKSSKEITLSEEVFGIEPNDHAIYLAVKVQRARMRQGTHSTKNRTAVSGGGRKPFRQKGRGTARAGTIRSGIWRHGGRIFGPVPHEYKMKIPHKVNQLARASVLSSRVAEEKFRVVENFSFENVSTNELTQFLKGFEFSAEKVLILTSEYDSNLVKSARNLANCAIRVGAEASTYDLMNYRMLLVMEGAVEKLTEVLRGRKRTAEKAA